MSYIRGSPGCQPDCDSPVVADSRVDQENVVRGESGWFLSVHVLRSYHLRLTSQ